MALQISDSESRRLLEALQSEMIKNGFDPIDNDKLIWRGPISNHFEGITESKTMDIQFRDGWPFRHPRVIVKGIQKKHVNEEGVVCLWSEHNASMEWLSFEGIQNKIEKWCEKAKNHFVDSDRSLDAHLYFEKSIKNLAIVNISELINQNISDGYIQNIYGKRDANKNLHIKKIRKKGDLRGVLYFRSRIKVPPKNLKLFRECLHSTQISHFDNLIMQFKKNKFNNSPCFIVLVWSSGKYLDGLCIGLVRDLNRVSAVALVIAPNDHETLVMRNKEYFDVLENKNIVLFGVGSVGSYLTTLLVKTGLKNITLVDSDTLRPGNIIRHYASKKYVGEEKVKATKNIIYELSNNTIVDIINQQLWEEDELVSICKTADLIVDVTGNNAFSFHLSKVLYKNSLDLIHVSLYNGGNIGRLRYQSKQNDWPIHNRRSTGSPFPIIPPSEKDIIGLETGCSSPINRAKISSIIRISASAYEQIIKVLSTDIDNNYDIIEVYEEDKDSKFNKIGTFRYNG